jgi:hypothetical protein
MVCATPQSMVLGSCDEVREEMPKRIRCPVRYAAHRVLVGCPEHTMSETRRPMSGRLIDRKIGGFSPQVMLVKSNSSVHAEFSIRHSLHSFNNNIIA